MFVNLVALLAAMAAGPAAGRIEGTVVRAVDQSPVAAAEVVLRTKAEGQWIIAAETVADAQGRFRFEGLPADGAHVYLPGGNHDGIRYPGPNLRLTGLRPRAEVKLAVSRCRRLSQR